MFQADKNSNKTSIIPKNLILYGKQYFNTDLIEVDKCLILNEGRVGMIETNSVFFYALRVILLQWLRAVNPLPQ